MMRTYSNKQCNPSSKHGRGGGQHKNYHHQEGKTNGWGSLIPMLEA
jgi:hypothetical protein